MSREVLEFLSNLLNQITLQAGAPDFEEAALVVIKARREVAEALAQEASSGTDSSVASS